MTDLIQLKNARYKGVDMLFESAPTTGGNRLIAYNFPGSDKQAIEVQGKAPNDFSLTVWIPHDDYYAKRDNLIRVLEDAETGVLTHPTFGDIDNVINGIYTLTETISELGRAKIVIPFKVDDAVGIPQQSGQLVSQVQQQQSVLNTSLDNDLGTGYGINLNFPGNFTDGLLDAQSVSAAFKSAATLATPINTQAAEFAKLINAYDDGIGDLIRAPASLAASISNIFVSLDNLYDKPADVLRVMRGLFNFGDDDPEVNETTVARVERKKNRDLIRANMKTQALGYAYFSAADQEYETDEALDLVQDLLEEQYLDVRDNERLSNESLEQLDRLRVQAQKTLDNARVTASSIITVETRLMPLSVFVYSYYGSTDNMDTIAALNNINQNAFIEGEIRILAA